MASLLPLSYEPLPTGQVKPRGWLLGQLRIQADGLSGHLDEFWPDVRDSRWFGGEAEGWERAPYWLDGVIPLAYLLADDELIRKVHRYVKKIVAQQQENGWLGPVEKDLRTGQVGVPQGYDLWAELLVFKMLVEFHRATSDDSILNVLEKALYNFDHLIDTRPLFNWGQFRWFEGLIAIFYLYDRNPQSWLLDLAVKIQAQGFHWGAFFQRWPYTEPTQAGRWNYMSHVVNNAMAVKSHGLWQRVSGSDADRHAVYEMLEKLDQYHGMVTGVFSGDECLAGKRPTQGTELCAVNEFAYSLECLFSLLGDPVFCDRLESVIYNALPATFSPDMWAHQYDQQVNQVECSIRENRTWNTNGPESNLFGLEPNFGCCTANLSQGWPKYAAHLWMRSSDNGLVAASYAPCRIETEIRDTTVTIDVDTDYPFRETIKLRIATSAPVSFPVRLRIPAWADGASAVIGDKVIEAQVGDFLRLEQQWEGETYIILSLPMRPRLIEGYRGSAAIAYGPLIFALPLDEEWRRVHVDHPLRDLPHADFEVYALSSWNYGLLLSTQEIESQTIFNHHPVGEFPFSPSGSPISATVHGRKLPDWKIINGSADDVPLSPVYSDQAMEKLVLIPYGCTNLRVTEFPLLES